MASSAGSLLSLVLGKGCDSNLDTYGLGGAGAVLLLPGRPAEAVPVLRSCGQAFTGIRAGDSARCSTLLGAADQRIKICAWLPKAYGFSGRCYANLHGLLDLSPNSKRYSDSNQDCTQR
eukprot:s5974_g9.t2